MKVNEDDMIADLCQSIAGKYLDNIRVRRSFGNPVFTYEFIGEDGSSEGFEIRQNTPLNEISIEHLGSEVTGCYFTEDGNLLIDFGGSGICVENWKPDAGEVKG